MKPIVEFNKQIKILFTDIDDTLTTDGQLHPNAYSAMWKIADAGISVVPVTGRPAGWCEMIARQWPVQGVIGENGAFYFRYHNKKMSRFFFIEENQRLLNQEKLNLIREEVLNSVAGCAVSSDQFCRIFDLAIDFCEDVIPLNNAEIQKIVDVFTRYGAQAKISSIHVNGWFGTYDKLTMVLKYLENEWSINQSMAKTVAGFIGDSPNDEPMFAYFPISFGVANIQNFISKLKSPPSFIASKEGGSGFEEIANQIIKFK